jgi:hypothetical protein
MGGTQWRATLSFPVLVWCVAVNNTAQVLYVSTPHNRSYKSGTASPPLMIIRSSLPLRTLY